MASFTWKTVPIKPTTIVTSWTVVVVRINVWIAWVICNWLRETNRFASLVFSITLIWLICLGHYFWVVRWFWRFYILPWHFRQILHYHNVFVSYRIVIILCILYSSDISHFHGLYPILICLMKIPIRQVWSLSVFAISFVRVCIVFCHFSSFRSLISISVFYKYLLFLSSDFLVNFSTILIFRIG